VLIQYHQGRLGDFLSEFHRIKVVRVGGIGVLIIRRFSTQKRISETWETAQLMKGGRRGRDTGWSDDMHEAMRERQSLTGSHMAADRVLAQAAHANTDLEAQRKRLSGVGDRLHNMTRSIPGLNSLMTRIRGKRERDRMVVAGAIGLCVTVLILYALY
jgi:Golgi SNAP receptor complex protein 1